MENQKENNSTENIKGYVGHNYKMKYAKDKRGFGLIVGYKKKNYFAFIEETLLAQAINNNQIEETMEGLVDNITKKIINKLNKNHGS